MAEFFDHIYFLPVGDGHGGDDAPVGFQVTYPPLFADIAVPFSVAIKTLVLLPGEVAVFPETLVLNLTCLAPSKNGQA